MRHALLLLASSALAASAFAQSKPAVTKVGCAVMTGSPVDIAKATKNKMFADYKGRRYFFCCGGCPGAFKRNPAKYAKGPSIPTPKKKA